MLVLARRIGEKVILTIDKTRIVLTVVEVRGDKARIGFEAPQTVKIHREEVQQDIDNERSRP